MKRANLSLGGECLGHGGSVAINVRFWGKADITHPVPMSAFDPKSAIESF
jgi:hypothetical protein